MGRCPSCGEWNTLLEEVESGEPVSIVGQILDQPSALSPVPVKEVSAARMPRLKTSDAELNRVLGGGVVPGSLILLGGEPGIGKSTLALQVALHTKGNKFLYVSGEESYEQIRMRADRLGIDNEEVILYAGTRVEDILAQAGREGTGILIIDSIQTIRTSTIESAPGSITQIRESTHLLQQFAKQSNIPVLIIGHITKEGVIAGPKLLEHMVDVVLQFEGEGSQDYRMLRSIKNRFGSVAELGLYEMSGSGLKGVHDPSSVLLTHREAPVAGVALTTVVEGGRAFVLEIQALVTSSFYGTPQRSSTGFDSRRLNMLLAVLDKKCGFHVGDKDIFLNVAGGMKIRETCADLAVAASLISSFSNAALPLDMYFIGEVSLTGEIRGTGRMDIRRSEAGKLGLKTLVGPSSLASSAKGIELIKVNHIGDLVALIRKYQQN